MMLEGNDISEDKQLALSEKLNKEAKDDHRNPDVDILKRARSVLSDYGCSVLKTNLYASKMYYDAKVISSSVAIVTYRNQSKSHRTKGNEIHGDDYGCINGECPGCNRHTKNVGVTCSISICARRALGLPLFIEADVHPALRRNILEKSNILNDDNDNEALSDNSSQCKEVLTADYREDDAGVCTEALGDCSDVPAELMQKVDQQIDELKSVVNSRREKAERHQILHVTSNILNLLTNAARVGTYKVNLIHDRIQSSSTNLFAPSLASSGQLNTKRKKSGREVAITKRRKKSTCSYCSGAHNWQNCHYKDGMCQPTYLELDRFLEAMRVTSSSETKMVDDTMYFKDLPARALSAVPRSFRKYTPNVIFVTNIYC